MKKTLLLGLIALTAAPAAHAGGLLNNTSLHALYLRSLARNASLAIDATYYNPAGLVFTPDGWRFSVNSQTVLQRRDIDATFAPFAYSTAGTTTKRFEGKATAPIVPTLMASYKKGDWAFSAVAGVFGGGGKASFTSGLPQFEANVALVPTITQAIAQKATAMIAALPAGALPPAAQAGFAKLIDPIKAANKYAVDSKLEGLQYVFGLQAGASYKINQHLSAYLGARLSYAYNTYTGYIRNIQVSGADGAMHHAPTYFGAITVGAKAAEPIVNNLPDALKQQVQPVLAVPGLLAKNTLDKRIEVKQTGIGLAPIVGLNFNYEGLNVGARYEFRTAIRVKNTTEANDSGMEQFADGAKVANDLPAVLGVGASYRLLPTLTAAVGYNHFFEKSANMAGDKQKTLKGNTNEYLFGLEWNALDWLDVSGGVQITRKGVSDAYQSNIHFDMSSTSYGLGVGLHLTKEAQLNLAYMISSYGDHKKTVSTYAAQPALGIALPGSEVYTRKNQIFSIGLDYTL
ncbi:MAG: FadL protein [Porphyromonadaceae bacterium]|nr:FadL protein [Porphyromonadaceae bacterium]